MDFKLFGIIGAGLAALGLVTTVPVIAQQSVDVSTSGLQAVVEWLRVAGGLIGMIVGMVGVWLYYRVMRKQKTSEALQTTVDIYKQQIEALSSEKTRLDNERVAHALAVADREKEIIALKSRTDISLVLETLTAFMKQSEARYGEGMKVLNGLLEHLGANSKDGMEQTRKNYELIGQMVKSIDALSRRFGSVEHKLEATKQSVDAVAADAGIGQHEEPEHQREERRRVPR
jgi:hypothetical protein